MKFINQVFENSLVLHDFEYTFISLNVIHIEFIHATLDSNKAKILINISPFSKRNILSGN